MALFEEGRVETEVEKRIMNSRIGVSKAFLQVEKWNRFLRWTSLQPSSSSSAAQPWRCTPLAGPAS
jgi:hypothetical protein